MVFLKYSHARALLSSLALAQMTLGAVLTKREEEEASMHSLCNDDKLGASVYHKSDTNWDTSWLGASIGAFAHADPDTLKQRYTKDGKALESCEDKTKVAYDDLPKDTDKKDDSWLVAAFQTAANRMGGYLGLEDKSIAFGDPSDAYYMLSGKWPLMTHLDGNNPDGDAENLVGGPDTDKDVLFALLEKCNDQPIIFGTGANPDRSDENLQPWTWYGVTNVNYGDPEEGKKPYTDAHIVFWHGKENWEKVLKFGDLYDDIRKVVHFE